MLSMLIFVIVLIFLRINSRHVLLYNTVTTMSQDKEVLQQVFNSIFEEQFPQNTKVYIKPVTSDANNTSSLFEATITAVETYEIFAKVVSMGDTLNTISNQIFDNEQFVYKVLSNAYEMIQNKYGIIREKFTFPKCYATDTRNGIRTVILENLKSKGYDCYDRLKAIDWNYASKCVETLANFHALSLALSKEHPEVFELAKETLRLNENLTGPEWDGITDEALAAVNEIDREKVSQLFEGFKGWTKFKELHDPCKTLVIIHGDYRASNLMHKEVDGGLHVIPVDYQTVRLGCPVGDLIYFIMMGSDQQFRRQYFKQLVDHYYQKLTLAMTRLSLVPEDVYGREEFEKDLKAKLPIGLCVAAIVLPYVTVDPANAPNFQQGLFVPRASELFKQRFQELVEDFKQWGII